VQNIILDDYIIKLLTKSKDLTLLSFFTKKSLSFPPNVNQVRDAAALIDLCVRAWAHRN
jgi:hypothetical protein